MTCSVCVREREDWLDGKGKARSSSWEYDLPLPNLKGKYNKTDILPLLLSIGEACLISRHEEKNIAVHVEKGVQRSTFPNHFLSQHKGA